MNIVMIDNDYNFCNNLAQFLKSHGDFNVLKIFNNRDSIEFINDNKKNLDLIMVDMEVQDITIEELLAIIAKNCNIIAFSENKKTVDKYINYPYFQRIFQKPISFSIILNYLSIQNGIETFEDYKKTVLNTLSKLGFNINHAGTMYLADGTTIAIKNKLKKLSEIYILIAHIYNTDPKIVGWSINNAINKTVKSDKIDKIQSFFNIQTGQKLTAKYIISYFLTYNNSNET